MSIRICFVTATATAEHDAIPLNFPRLWDGGWKSKPILCPTEINTGVTTSGSPRRAFEEIREVQVSA